MEYGTDRGSGILVVKLDHGTDLFQALGRALDHHAVTSGAILAGIGMLDGVELGYFTGGKYETERLGTPVELVSLQGTIAAGPDKKRVIHLHAGVAGVDHIVRGGHLLKGTVWIQNEIIVRPMTSVRLDRRPDPEHKLNVLTVTPAPAPPPLGGRPATRGQRPRASPGPSARPVRGRGSPP